MGCSASRAATSKPELDIVRVQDSVAVAKKRMQPGHLQALNNRGSEADGCRADEEHAAASPNRLVTFATSDDTATAVSKIRAQNVQDSVIVTKERMRAAGRAAGTDDEESPDSYISSGPNSNLCNSICQDCSGVSHFASEAGTADNDSKGSNARRRAAVDDTAHDDVVHNLQCWQPESSSMHGDGVDSGSANAKPAAVQFADDLAASQASGDVCGFTAGYQQQSSILAYCDARADASRLKC